MECALINMAILRVVDAMRFQFNLRVAFRPGSLVCQVRRISALSLNNYILHIDDLQFRHYGGAVVEMCSAKRFCHCVAQSEVIFSKIILFCEIFHRNLVASDFVVFRKNKPSARFNGNFINTGVNRNRCVQILIELDKNRVTHFFQQMAQLVV